MLMLQGFVPELEYALLPRLKLESSEPDSA